MNNKTKFVNKFRMWLEVSNISLTRNTTTTDKLNSSHIRLMMIMMNIQVMKKLIMDMGMSKDINKWIDWCRCQKVYPSWMKYPLLKKKITLSAAPKSKHLTSSQMRRLLANHDQTCWTNHQTQTQPLISLVISISKCLSRKFGPKSMNSCGVVWARLMATSRLRVYSTTIKKQILLKTWKKMSSNSLSLTILTIGAA